MFINSNFGKTMDILHRTMDSELLRRNVISDNIANADTPHFKRSVVNFESELKRALRPEREMSMSVKLSWSKQPADYKDVRATRELDYLTSSDNNGNNVELEQEMMLAVQNQMRYSLMTQAVNSQFQRMNSVLR